LDGEAGPEQVRSREVGLHLDHCVQVVGLGGPAHRLALVHTRGPKDPDALGPAEQVRGPLEIRQSIAQVGAKADVRAHDPQRTVAEAATSSTPSDRAALGLWTVAVTSSTDSKPNTALATASARVSSSAKLSLPTAPRAASARAR